MVAQAVTPVVALILIIQITNRRAKLPARQFSE